MSEKVKISIITVCYNSQSTIARCIRSVASQSYDNYEHIIVDGESKDSTLSIIDDLKTENCIVISEKDQGIYDAMNKGIAVSSGDLIGILNSDDYYSHTSVLNEVHDIYRETGKQLISGAVYFVDQNGDQKRRIQPKYFRPWMLFFGWMLPHTSTFVAAEIYKKCGTYDTALSTAADYEFFVRILLKKSFTYYSCNQNWASMQLGGATTSGFKSYLRTTKQMKAAIRKNGFFASNILLSLRLPVKFLTQRLWIKK